MENFSVTPAKRRRLEYVRRQFPCFNCCSPLLARRRRYNAVAKIGDSLVDPDVRMKEVVIGSSLEVVIGSSLEVVIGSSLEVMINNSLEVVAINDSLEAAIDDSLEAAIDNSLKVAINEISPSDELPISPLDELPISPSDKLPISPSDKLPISPLDELPISPLDELPISPLDKLPIKNNKLKNRNSQVKYRERRKKEKRLAAAFLAGNPTSDPDSNPLTAVTSPSTSTSCPQACDGALPPMTAMTLPPIALDAVTYKVEVLAAQVEWLKSELLSDAVVTRMELAVGYNAAASFLPPSMDYNINDDDDDVIVVREDASEKCKEAGGAQDSIDNDNDETTKKFLT